MSNLFLTEFGVRVELVPDMRSPLRGHVIVRRLQDGKTLDVDMTELTPLTEISTEQYELELPKVRHAVWKDQS